jgi:hypothetical protein
LILKLLSNEFATITKKKTFGWLSRWILSDLIEDQLSCFLGGTNNAERLSANQFIFEQKL